MTSKPAPKFNRRQFLTTSSAALVLPLIVPACVVGRDRTKARPSNRITLGVVGWGTQGPGNTAAFLAEKDCQVVAACELDKNRLQSAADRINQHYQNKDCAVYHDYRELMARPEIDAVMLAVPDHWHGLVATEAARHKKDIYGEKPLARTIAEQQAIVKAVQKHKVIWQTGSWQRSEANFHKGAEIVRNGLIGKITRVEVGLPAGHSFSGMPKDEMTISAPPPELDYEMWLGPARWQPYIKGRVHANWRWNYNTGGGMLLDWVGHHCDIAHWGMDCDRSGPLTVEGHGEFPPAGSIWNTCTRYRVELKYPQDITMTIAGGHDDIRAGTKWIGTDGWVWVDRGGFDASNPDWSNFKSLPEPLRRVKLYRSKNHQRNFLDCIKSRQPTITPVETAHHSTIPGHLGLISMLVNRRLSWNSQNETILGDPEATKLLARPYRQPWKLKS